MDKKIKAIILCGGKGLRLRPRSLDIPKPLIQIKGKPILEYLINQLEMSNISEYIIAAGYKSEKISDYFLQTKFRKKVTIVDSGDVSIMLRIKDCLKEIKNDEDFMVLYGDTLADIDINSIHNSFYKNKKKSLVSLYKFKSPFGIMDIDQYNIVNNYQEKPVLDKWINIGYFMFSGSLFRNISDFNKFEDFLSYLIEIKELVAYTHNGIHYTVNTEKELQDLTENIEIFN